ncbi:unnamed protein product [Pleuronectes platessa]|uniref:Uncharacterized protein n=1 Tax=Pleuronectes platessa TaxID=8262 RepID=A0A9N7Y6L6_PLEPL|nr:unnamed protein product [Pleuronectes platessa]
MADTGVDLLESLSALERVSTPSCTFCSVQGWKQLMSLLVVFVIQSARFIPLRSTSSTSLKKKDDVHPIEAARANPLFVRSSGRRPLERPRDSLARRARTPRGWYRCEEVSNSQGPPECIPGAETSAAHREENRPQPSVCTFLQSSDTQLEEQAGHRRSQMLLMSRHKNSSQYMVGSS